MKALDELVKLTIENATHEELVGLAEERIRLRFGCASEGMIRDALLAIAQTMKIARQLGELRRQLESRGFLVHAPVDRKYADDLKAARSDVLYLTTGEGKWVGILVTLSSTHAVHAHSTNPGVVEAINAYNEEIDNAP